MSEPIEISTCTPPDYVQILQELSEFWDGRDMRQLHHPFLIHEFGHTAFVIRLAAQVLASLFGLSRRPSRLDMCIRSPSEHPRGGNISRSTFSNTSSDALATRAARTSRLSRHRPIRARSPFTRASAWSSWANRMRMACGSFPTMPAAAHRASSSGSPSRFLALAHVLLGKLASIPDRVRGGLFPGHALDQPLPRPCDSGSFAIS